eukprot:3939225-Ditylum_brightwellii.AAC.1
MTTIVPPLPPLLPPPNDNSAILICPPCASLLPPNATSATLTPNVNMTSPTCVNFASPSQIVTSAIPASFLPPTPNIPPANESPQRKERRDLLSVISHQLGCNESDCNRSTQSVRNLLGNAQIAHKLLGSKNEDDVQNSAVGNSCKLYIFRNLQTVT